MEEAGVRKWVVVDFIPGRETKMILTAYSTPVLAEAEKDRIRKKWENRTVFVSDRIYTNLVGQ